MFTDAFFFSFCSFDCIEESPSIDVWLEQLSEQILVFFFHFVPLMVVKSFHQYMYCWNNSEQILVVYAMSAFDLLLLPMLAQGC